jgi:hypothetical protein
MERQRTRIKFIGDKWFAGAGYNYGHRVGKIGMISIPNQVTNISRNLTDSKLKIDILHWLCLHFWETGQWVMAGHNCCNYQTITSELRKYLKLSKVG